MNVKSLLFAIVWLFCAAVSLPAQNGFVEVENGRFVIDKRPYYFIGTNYWYGSLLGLEKDKRRGVERLRRELDFLKANGVTNLRLLAGAEGAGLINGVERVGPPLQTAAGVFDEKVLDGLDLILAEMARRDMKAVVFFSNNWEWSGGFQQYLIWHRRIPADVWTRKLTWDEQRDIVSRFYDCAPCVKNYHEHLSLVVNRTNKVNGRRYREDATVMAWELANEPRPMRPAAVEAYRKWIAATAALIKKQAPRQLVTLGHEGRIGTESMELFEEIHRDPNVDYLTIHIWAKNWNWFREGKLKEDYPQAAAKMLAYIDEHLPVAVRLKKPLVVEEFGLPRDEHSFDPQSPTALRDDYYGKVLARLAAQAEAGGPLAGANFWAFGGTARPVGNQIFWKKGDEYMGDPPMEEQGLNTVFDSDRTTWELIKKYAGKIKN